MRIIISPAKKMNIDTDSPMGTTSPLFLAETEKIQNALRKLSAKSLQDIWKCNDAIAAQNVERLQRMDLKKHLTPAILSYEGIQYQYMAPGVFEQREYRYTSEHLRILSGFYGLLRPFDGVVPYRLEMQAKLAVDGQKDLYAFWGNKIANQLCEETDFILNLASKEYSKVLTPHLPKNIDFLTCSFGELKDGKVIEKGTMCKMARGEMVRYLAQQGITDRDGIKTFHRLGYTYANDYSTENNFVYLKGGDSHAGSEYEGT